MTIAVPCAHASAAGRLRCRGSVLETASRPGSVPKPVRQTSREPQLVRGYGGLPSGGAGLSQPLSSDSQGWRMGAFSFVFAWLPNERAFFCPHSFPREVWKTEKK